VMMIITAGLLLIRWFPWLCYEQSLIYFISYFTNPFNGFEILFSRVIPRTVSLCTAYNGSNIALLSNGVNIPSQRMGDLLY
jgi:hypothetical protein